jgi:Hint domain
MATTIDQSGTISSGLLTLGGDFIIENIPGTSAGAVIVTLDAALISAGNTFMAQNEGALVLAPELSVGIGDSFDIGQNGTIEVGSGISASIGGEISFLSGTSGGDLVLQQGADASLLTEINGFANGDTIDLQGVGSLASTVVSVSEGTVLLGGLNDITTLSVSLAAGGTETFQVNGNLIDDSFSAASDGNGGIALVDAPCFAEGTLILTTRGEVPVETLAQGDDAILVDGRTAPIVFVGHRRLDLTQHPRPHTVRPIRVLAGALADGIPQRDLLLSPDHALYLNDVLVPVKDLVDGVFIKQDSSFRSVRYFHIELENHGIIFAEGAAAESFLNTGHRGLFENSDEPLLLHPDLMNMKRMAESCAPLVTCGEQLAEIRMGLRERVQTNGFDVADNARIELKIGDCVLKPIGSEDGRTIFAIPAGATSAVLSSPVFVPAEIDPASGDRRTLGVAIAEVMLDDGQVPLEAIFYAEDLHPRAANETASWSRGDVRLALPAEVGTISLRIVGWPRGWQAIQRAA